MNAEPYLLTFKELALATQDLHQWNRAHIHRLHDIWQMGAPLPDNDVTPRDFDERTSHLRVRRIVFPSKLAIWIEEIARARGWAISPAEALRIALGEDKAHGERNLSQSQTSFFIGKR